MGKFLGAITGSNSATKKATRAANDAADRNVAIQREQINAATERLDPAIQRGNVAGDYYNALIGLPSGVAQPEAQGAFQNYLNNFGFDDALTTGGQAIRGNLASRRLLGSGATLKALNRFDLGLRDQFRGNFLNAVGGQQQTGLGAATALTGAGQNYAAMATANNNNRASVIGNAALAGAANNTNFLGSAISAAAMLSDERAKENIVQIGQLDQGPGIYSYNYKGSDTPQVGVLAQEAEIYRPDAVTTGRDGLKRVNYLALTHRRAA